MWLRALVSKTFVAKANMSDLLLDSLSVCAQAIVALFFGMYFSKQIGFTPTQLLVYYIFTLALINPLQRRSPLKEFEKQILNGTISQQLLRPFNFMVFTCARSYAQNILPSVVTCIIVIGFFVFVMPSAFASLTVAMLLRLVGASIITIILLYLTISIFLYLSFYLEQINAYYRIYFMAGFFVAGGFVPAAVFSSLTQYLPQYYLYGAPAQFVATGIITNPILWATYVCIFIALNFILHYVCMRKLEVNGG